MIRDVDRHNTNMFGFPNDMCRRIVQNCDPPLWQAFGLQRSEQHVFLGNVMGDFQRLSVALPFQETFNGAFAGYDCSVLTDEHMDALKLIHEQTKKWLVGYAIERTLYNLENTNKPQELLNRIIDFAVGTRGSDQEQQAQKYIVNLYTKEAENDKSKN